MIKWPERARVAIKKLFEPLQEIDVYVEDSNDEAFYRLLLNRVSQNKIHIARVFSLNGRQAVIEAAMKHDYSKRRALFIIDGDLEWVRGVPLNSIYGLHRHEAYCIENLLLCEKAITRILIQEAIIVEDKEYDIFGFKEWVSSIESPLLRLFSAFATANEFVPNVRTVSYGVGRMCKQIRGMNVLDESKVETVTKDVLSSAEEAVGNHRVMIRFNEILSRLIKLDFPLHSVSGKDFILPLLNFKLQHHGCRVRFKSLRARLAESGDTKRFIALGQAILNASLGIP